MAEPIFFKRSFSVAVIALVASIMPSIVATAMLYLIARLYSVRFDELFVLLSVLIATLSSLLYQPLANSYGQLTSDWVSVSLSVIARWMMLLGLLLTIGYATKLSEEFSRLALFTWAFVTPALLVPTTLLCREFVRRVLSASANVRKVVFAGFNDVNRTLAERIARNSSLCMSVAGFFDDRSAERLAPGSDVQLLGRLPELSTYVKAHSIDVIFVALPMRHLPRVMGLLDDLRDTTASIYYVPDIFVFDLIQARTGDILGIPVVAMCETPFYGFRGVSKRLFDTVFASILLLLMAPLMLFIALLIRLSSKGPAIFRQRRYGLDGEEITVYKFRSMKVMEDGGEIRQASRDDDRLTSIGRYLRRSSLDELPQFINVIQGRMSLVGPRPHAVAHNEMYRKLIKGYMMRHKVLPGITGLAQVNGLRGETRQLEQMEARVRYDLEYLRNWSVLLDLKILAQTAVLLIKDRNAF